MNCNINIFVTFERKIKQEAWKYASYYKIISTHMTIKVLRNIKRIHQWNNYLAGVMTSVSDFLEEILEECGGLGRFQWLLLGSIICGKVSITWTTLMMSFGGAIPDWRCEWGNDTVTYENITGESQTCSTPTNHSDLTCIRKVYDDSMHTVVNQVGTQIPITFFKVTFIFHLV